MKLNMFKKWLRDDKAVIAIEVGILMPVMLTMLLGVMDIGTGIYINQKLINADQMVADLLTRNATVSQATDLPNALAAGQATMLPYSAASFGVDIVSVQFGNPAPTPAIGWRYTVNMLPNQAVPANTVGLGNASDGVVVVTAVYTYVPFFVGGLANTSYAMQEISFARGRNGLFIPETS